MEGSNLRIHSLIRRAPATGRLRTWPKVLITLQWSVPWDLNPYPMTGSHGSYHWTRDAVQFNYNMKFKKNRTFHDLLDMNDEFSHYLLGFWMADGNIFISTSKGRKTPQKAFAVSNTDLQIMTDIGLKFGKEPKPIKPNTRSKQQCYVIKVKSDRLFDKCYEITQSTSKSDKSVAIPDLKPEAFRHFVRGFFDGDGSIYIKHYKNKHNKMTSELGTSFTAGKDTGSFLERLRDQIRKRIPVGLKKIYTGKSQKLIFCQYDSMLLCEWMYQDATIFMKRKKDIWDSTDKERLKRSKKYFSNKV